MESIFEKLSQKVDKSTRINNYELTSDITLQKSDINLSLVDNKNLQRLPECIGDMPNLMVLNIPGAEGKNIIPDSVLRRADEDEDFNLFT